MDELTVLDDLGTALDHPADLRALRHRTLRDLRTGRRRRFHVNRSLLMAFAATATAALIIVPFALLTGHPERGRPPAATPTVEPTSNGRLALAARAQQAAATGKPLAMPRSDQYIYVETRASDRERTSRGWRSVDHERPDITTDYRTGRLRWDCFFNTMDPPDYWATDFARPPARCPVNKRGWAAPTGIPVTPAAFASWFPKHYTYADGGYSLFDRAHHFLIELQLLDPRVTPSLFLMLIDRPEIELVGPDRDQLGRLVVGLSEKTDPADPLRDSWTLLFDPRTFAYLGRREYRPRFDTRSEESVIRIAVVDRAGQRPE